MLSPSKRNSEFAKCSAVCKILHAARTMLKFDSKNEWYQDTFVSNGPSQASVPAGLLKNDFIPTSYQRELARSIEDSSKVVFLPAERDKLYTALFAVKNFTSELTRYVIYASKVLHLHCSFMNIDSLFLLLCTDSEKNLENGSSTLRIR